MLEDLVVNGSHYKTLCGFILCSIINGNAKKKKSLEILEVFYFNQIGPIVHLFAI